MKNFFKKFKDLKPPIIEMPEIVKTPLGDYTFDKKTIYFKND